VNLIESRIFNVCEGIAMLIKRHTFPRIAWS
jgi:hypothetical protein